MKGWWGGVSAHASRICTRAQHALRGQIQRSLSESCSGRRRTRLRPLPYLRLGVSAAAAAVAAAPSAGEDEGAASCELAGSVRGAAGADSGGGTGAPSLSPAPPEELADAAPAATCILASPSGFNAPLRVASPAGAASLARLAPAARDGMPLRSAVSSLIDAPIAHGAGRGASGRPRRGGCGESGEPGSEASCSPDAAVQCLLAPSSRCTRRRRICTGGARRAGPDALLSTRGPRAAQISRAGGRGRADETRYSALARPDLHSPGQPRRTTGHGGRRQRRDVSGAAG